MSIPLRIRSAKTFYNADTKIWQGESVKSSYGPEDSIGAVALECLLKDPDHISQICYPYDREYTNRDIAQFSIRIALNLEKLNLKQGDIIGICASNSDFIAPLVFGTLLCGLTISTSDPSFEYEGIKHTFSLSRPNLMFCDGSIYQKVRKSLDDINLSSTKIYTVIQHIDGVPSIKELLEEHEKENEFKAPTLKDGSNQVAAILCSSGTTGLPKGVTISHARLLNACEYKMFPTDKFLVFSTLYWVAGITTVVQGTLNNLTRVISDRAFNTDDFFDIVQRYKVNIVLTAISGIAMSLASDKLNECDLSSIEFYLTGGSAVPYVLVEKFRQHAPNARIVPVYAMSEIATYISYFEADSNSVGQLNVNTEIKIINDKGEHMGVEENGEVCIRTKYPWSGYINNPEATKSAYDEDGWLHSGDIGYFDKSGNLFIVDRIKDILKYNNFHFYPNQIEKVISEIPDVTDVCVFGKPDLVSTFLPTAAVVKVPGSSLSEDEIYQHVVDRLEHFHHLRGGIYFFDSLPQTTSGKTIRRKVLELCENIRKEKLMETSELDK